MDSMFAAATLDEAQMAALGHCAGASLKQYGAGQTLIRAGERDFRFFVVRSGEIEIVDESGETPRSIAVLRRGEFTGDVAHLTGGPSLVSAVARSRCEVYEVSADGVREILNRFPDLGDVILQAFIARRQLLREPANFTGLRVVGSRYSRDTLRIREFLAKNRVLLAENTIHIASGAVSGIVASTAARWRECSCTIATSTMISTDRTTGTARSRITSVSPRYRAVFDLRWRDRHERRSLIEPLRR